MAFELFRNLRRRASGFPSRRIVNLALLRLQPDLDQAADGLAALMITRQAYSLFALVVNAPRAPDSARAASALAGRLLSRLDAGISVRNYAPRLLPNLLPNSAARDATGRYERVSLFEKSRDGSNRKGRERIKNNGAVRIDQPVVR